MGNESNRMNDGVYIGIDVGGTGIKGGIVTDTGSLLREQLVRTPIEEGRLGIMREIERLAQELTGQAESPVLGIGVGSAGAVDPVSGSIAYATDNLPGWTGTPLAESLSKRTGLPVFADNDVNAAALGELWTGAARHCDTFVLVALGTGVGGALVDKGRIVHGYRGLGGELGHMILYPEGAPCNCGQRGCYEQYVSGTALNRIAQAAHPDWSSYTFMKQYEEQEPRAVAAMERFIGDLATGLATITNMFGPETIVIGGGLAETASLWWSRLLAALDERTRKPVALATASLGNRAGIIGAAYLVKRSL